MDASIRSQNTMKAVVCREYGSADSISIEKVPIPTISASQVLVRVKAVSINPYDRYLMRGEPYLARIQFGLFSPKAKGLGQDFSGIVEAIGDSVTEFKVGDAVFGDVKQLFSNVDRAFAEYVPVTTDSIVLKPENIDFKQAAAIPMAARTALLAIRNHKKLNVGDKVLINGASGGVGTFAIQIAKSFGAEVTAVCSSDKQSLASALGADHVIDYTQQDFTLLKEQFDLILDVVSSRSFSDFGSLLDKDGVYVWVGASHVGAMFGPLWPFIKMSWVSTFMKNQTMVQAITPLLKEDLIFIRELVEQQKIIPVIDREYPFAELAKAINYLEEGHAKGKVVISIDEEVTAEKLE